jgi:hypothetical protein
VRRHDHLLGRDDADRERLCDQEADQGRDADRRQAVWRIAADNELETIEGAGERGTECASNSSGGATALGASQPECHADARGDTAGKLCIAGLQADRGADPARPDRLRRHDNAAKRRHATAVQRVGFDRIDFPLRPMACGTLLWIVAAG